MKKIEYSKEKEKMKILFQVSREEFYSVLDIVRSVKGRSFNKTEKTWYAPISKTEVRKLQDNGFSISDEIKKIILEQKKQKKEKMKIIKELNFFDPLLKSHQNGHAEKIIKNIIEHGASFDGSDTGTGKTYTAMSIAKYLKLTPVVLCIKSGISNWKKVAEYFGIKEIIVCNYEQFSRGNIPDVLSRKNYEDGKISYKWKTDKSDLIIFDEVHKCGNYKTLNAKMLLAAKRSESSVLPLSASIADNPTQLYGLGLHLGLFSGWVDFYQWCFDHGVSENYFGQWIFAATPENLQKVHNDIYSRGSRMRKEDIPGFPENQILPDIYNMSSAKKIQRIYDEMSGMAQITKRIKARKDIELLKVPTIVELAQDFIEQNYSVAIFVNFTDTIKELSKKLKCNCIVDGSVTGEARDKAQDNFLHDRARIIILNCGAGGQSISLHDIHGKHPRVSLINPPESSKMLLQVLGRIHREGSKSPAIQKLIFCADTIEEEVAANVKQKVENIQAINDGDLAEKIY